MSLVAASLQGCLLRADDISSASRTSGEMAQSIHPDVEWRGGQKYEDQPYKALVDTKLAKEVLQWNPCYRWRSDDAKIFL